MSTWTYTLDDDTTGTVEADDLNTASTAVAALAGERAVMLVQRVEDPAPTVVRSVSGADVVLDVSEGGVVTAAPIAP